ncbi:HNH endonuclease [Methylobacterium aquaticum]|nr:HNH endonuclease [Methylobacterium aquaticum]
MQYRRLRRYGDPLGGGTFAGQPMAFARQAAATKQDECITWPFGTDGHGYGRICSDGAHRIVCEIAHGLAPTSEHEAAHSCGNGHRGCVNPGHLRWATHKENHSDRILHGTNNAGETHGANKLTAQSVAEIRRLFADGSTKASLARSFNVSESCVRKIISGKNWRHA